jgi:diguanylate cyclase (GGDEF)-like protein
VFILFIIIIFATSYIFYRNIDSALKEFRIQNLEEVTVQQANAIQLGIEDVRRELKTLSVTVAEDFDEPSKLNHILENVIGYSNFKMISISDLNGKTLIETGNGKGLSIANDPLFKEVLKGQTVILDPNSSSMDLNMIKMATPVYKNSTLVAVLTVGIDPNSLKDVFRSTYKGTSQTHLFLANGEVFLSTGNNNTTEELDKTCNWIQEKFLLNSNKDPLNQDFSLNEPGFFRFNQNNSDVGVYLTPVGVNQWKLAVAVPYSTIKDRWNFLNFNIFYFHAIFILITGALLTLMYKKHQKYTNQITEITFVDWLTKGNNVTRFRVLAKEFLKKKKKEEVTSAICVLDIKDFRLINERYGHAEGDHVLSLMYQAIEKVFGDKAVYGRGHIDRFFILLPFEGEENLILLGKEIKQALNKLLLAENISYQVEYVCGIYVIDHNLNNIDNLLEKVNFALRYSKENKESLTILYDDEITYQEVAKMQLEEDLQKAFENNEFQVYLQPKFNLQNNCMVGAEALCRWKNANGKLIYPNKFIPILEKNKKIAKLDLYMFESVCKLQREWMNQGYTVYPISVNQSKILLFRDDYVETIKGIAESYNVPPHLISIELTETNIFEDAVKIKNLVESLRNFGFPVSIDDFGTGYSSLNLLKDIHVDTVKIDKSFVGDINDVKQNILLTEVVRLIKRLGMEALVEGVEKQDQLTYLKEVGADVCQGYIYDAPIPAKDFFQKYVQEKQLELVEN